MRLLCAGALALLLVTSTLAQDRLQNMPRYDRYEKLRREIADSVTRGALAVTWADDSQSFTYVRDGKTFRFDVASLTATETGDKPKSQKRKQRDRRNPERGRQFDTTFSADGKLKAAYRDRNVFVSRADGKNEVQVSTDGDEKARTKNGIASWVYGEELYVKEAMWFSPDAKKLAYYHFDESQVKDYFLALHQVDVQDTLDTEAYPKAGAPNPKVELRIYDVASKQTTRVDTGFGPDGETMGEYVYQVRWSPDGNELFFNRSNRKQNVMEWCAADRETGKCRVVLRESHPQSWTDNAPDVRFLEDDKRFLWRSDSSGFYNLSLYDVTGKLLAKITQHDFDVDGIVSVDEKSGVLLYTARDGANPYLVQLHRVGLDGKNDVRLTDAALNHTVSAAPDGKHIVDIAERFDKAPETRLLDAGGKVLATLATSDLTKYDALRLQPIRRIAFPAADGKTTLYGSLEVPSDFDPAKKYPVVVNVYAGPESGGTPERFRTPDPVTEFGFIVASFEGRGTNGRGKAFREAVYGNLGIVEIDDQAAGAKYLQGLPYVDGRCIGIQGTSYGGYASAMSLLRHPEAFASACACSGVTDWRNYDSIYTERYMGLPGDGENKDGYENGRAMKYAANLKGRLMLYYGTADNNVHPSNTLQLAKALNEAGKSYEMMVGPDMGHTGLNFRRSWEFFIDTLILGPRNSDPLAVRMKKRRKHT